MQRSGDEPLHKHSPTSLHLSRHDRETKELLLVVCWESNPLTWMCNYATWFEPCGVYVIHEHTRAATRCFLHPADTTCRGHVLMLGLDCSAVYRRSVTICTDGTAQRQARDVLCVCLVTDLSSVHAWGVERSLSSQLLPLAVCVLVAPGLPLRLWLMCCVSMWPRCSGNVIYTEKCTKMVKMTTSDASSTIALFLSFQDAKKRHFTESHWCNSQR